MGDKNISLHIATPVATRIEKHIHMLIIRAGITGLLIAQCLKQVNPRISYFLIPSSTII
jgi:hypothetical protein